MIPQEFIIISPILAFIGGFFYIRDTLRGQTKPNRVSFFIWALVPILSTIIALQEGASWEILPAFLTGFIPLLVFFASFINKNAYWKLGRRDYIAGVLSFIAIILWLVVDLPIWAFAFLIIADLLAYIPTYIKGWTNPETETSISYLLAVVGNIIGLLIVQEWVFTSYGFSLYIIFANTILLLILFRKRLF